MKGCRSSLQRSSLSLIRLEITANLVCSSLELVRGNKLFSLIFEINILSSKPNRLTVSLHCRNFLLRIYFLNLR